MKENNDIDDLIESGKDEQKELKEETILDFLENPLFPDIFKDIRKDTTGIIF